ncbi:MAG: recombinase family protein [Alphaproteobacteria bacterium]
MVNRKARGKRVAIYARVSTNSQTVQNQLRDLREVAKRQGWEITKVYQDAGISGAKGRDKRPAFDAMLTDAIRRKFDILAAWSVDRIGRSLKDLVETLSELHASGIDLYLHKQGIDTRTPTGKAMFGMLGVFAEFEREMIRERVNAGLARTVAKGTKLGRPRMDGEREADIRAMLATGAGIRKTARECKAGIGAVTRIKEAMQRGAAA